MAISSWQRGSLLKNPKKHLRRVHVGGAPKSPCRECILAASWQCLGGLGVPTVVRDPASSRISSIPEYDDMVATRRRGSQSEHEFHRQFTCRQKGPSNNNFGVSTPESKHPTKQQIKTPKSSSWSSLKALSSLHTPQLLRQEPSPRDPATPRSPRCQGLQHRDRPSSNRQTNLSDDLCGCRSPPGVGSACLGAGL